MTSLSIGHNNKGMPRLEANSMKGSLSDLLYLRLWSCVQRITAALMLVMLSPLFVILYVVVRISSPGPFLFCQQRPGLNGVTFTAYKIRTMSKGAEKQTALGVTAANPTITRVGRILRELKLDELPQLWNIIRGDMEFVGPRPLPVALHKYLRENIAGFKRRLSVRPGLTCLGQITVLDNGVGESLLDDWQRRYEGDMHYVQHKTAGYDIVVIAMTCLYLVRKALIHFRRNKNAALSSQPPISHDANVTRVIDVPIANMNYEQVLNTFKKWIQNREHRYVCICPVHSLIDAVRLPSHRQVLQRADLNTADGMPVVWAQNLLGHRTASRVYGPTLMLKGLSLAEKNGWRVAFYGGHEDRLRVLTESLRKRFPRLNIVAAISPPFRQMSEKEKNQMVTKLTDARPDIVWVGLGAPKQEAWMAENSPKIPGVMIGVGAAFDFHAGAVRQAPSNLQKYGLEWLFRLYCEPKRLFKRYAIANPTYVALITWQLLKHVVLRQQYQEPLCVSPVSTEHTTTN